MDKISDIIIKYRRHLPEEIDWIKKGLETVKENSSLYPVIGLELGQSKYLVPVTMELAMVFMEKVLKEKQRELERGEALIKEFENKINE